MLIFLSCEGPKSVLLICGVAGCCAFIVVFLIDGWTRPRYSTARHTISALALGRRGWVQTASFLISGTGLIAGGLGALQAQTSGFFAGMLGLVGIGLIASGLFPMDPMRGYPPGTSENDPLEFSMRHKLHDHAGMVVFFGIPLTAFAAGFALEGMRANIVAGVVTAVLVAGVAAFSSAWERDSPATGVIQKAVVVVAFGWIAAVLLIISVH